MFSPLPSSSLLPQGSDVRRTTLKDVAVRAGVSHTAVSVVLNGAKGGNTGVSEVARERILMAAEELGYRRNGSMSAMRSGRFKAVGLLLSTDPYASTVPALMWNGMQQELEERDLHLIIQRLPDSQLTDETFVPKMLREWMCDGLLIDYTNNIPPRLLELLHQNRVPALWLNTNLPLNSVYPNNFEGGRAAAQHLLDLGHRRIVYSGCHDYRIKEDSDLPPSGAEGQHIHFSCKDRRDGCRAGLEAAGIEWIPSSLPVTLPYQERVELWRQKFLSPQRPTGVVTYESGDCEMVLRAAELAGLNVPTDLSVISFTSLSRYRVHGQEVTCMQVPEYQIGQTAVQQLMHKIERPERDLPPLVIPFVLVPGATCAPAPLEK